MLSLLDLTVLIVVYTRCKFSGTVQIYLIPSAYHVDENIDNCNNDINQTLLYDDRTAYIDRLDFDYVKDNSKTY